jgi:hypothetical protein
MNTDMSNQNALIWPSIVGIIMKEQTRDPCGHLNVFFPNPAHNNVTRDLADKSILFVPVTLPLSTVFVEAFCLNLLDIAW